jgi:hypothetical protein
MSRRYSSLAASFGCCALAGVLSTVACSDDNGGSPNPSAGGSSNAGGTSNAGTSNAGTSNAGTSNAGTSNGGTSNGGTGGMTPYACANKVPPSAEITDFSMVPEWGDTAEFGGGHYVYPSSGGMAITADTAAGDLTVSGTIGTYSGFGLYFAHCSDASAFTGVQFDISGDVGASGMLNFLVQTNETYQIRTGEMKGACAWTEATEYSACVPPGKMIAVTDTTQTLTIPWTDLMGGVPVSTVSSNQLIGLQFQFAWTDGGTPYDVNVTIDNVRFTGGNGSGGSGGTGGTGQGGEGGAP